MRKYIRDNHTVETLYDSDALSVSFDFPDPLVAQKVLSILIDHYIAHHIDVYKNKNETGLIDFKLRESREKYDKALAEYTAFIDKHKIYDERQIEMLVEKRNQLLTTIANTRAEHQYHLQKLQTSLKEITDITPYEKYNTVEVLNDRRERLQSKLNESRLEKQNLGQKYTGDSRLIVDIDKEIETLKKMIAEEPQRIVDSVDSRKNSNYWDLDQSIVDLKTTVAGEKGKIYTLEAELDALDRELSQTAHSYQRFTLLKKDLNLAKITYEKYYDGFLESDLSNVSQDLNVTNLSIVEPPSLNPIPTKPHKKKVLVFAVVFLLAGNVLILMVLNMTGSGVNKPDDIERVFGQRPVATLGLDESPDMEKAGTNTKFYKNHIKDFQRLAINLTLDGSDDKVFLIGRSRPLEGGTTVAYNLAAFLAYSQNKKVAFVDYVSSRLANKKGKETQIMDGKFRQKAIGQVDYLQYKGKGQNKYEDLEGKYSPLIELRKKYDYVFCNIPPVNDSVDLVFLNNHVDRVVFLVEAERTKMVVIKYNIGLLKQYGLDSISFVLNKRRFYIPRFLYKYV